MEIVKKTGGGFGESFFEIKDRNIPKDGIRIEKPLGGDFVIYSQSDGQIHDSSEYPSGVIYPKKKGGLFNKKIEEETIRVYFINKSPLQCPGFVSVPAFDVCNCVNWSVTYDVDIVYSEGRSKEFISFILGKNLQNCGGMKKPVFDKLSIFVNNVVKEVIGEYNEQSVEWINSNNLMIAEKILSRLNSLGGGIYDCGFEATKFSFNVQGDYKYEQEKKRIQLNRMINKYD